MSTRLKSTLAGLTVWGLFMAGALLLGTPVDPSNAPAADASTPAAILVADDTSPTTELRGNRRKARHQLAMPYFSFGGLLPRQES